MAILKFEVDTNEMFKGYEEGGGSIFEDLFKDALTQEVKRFAIESASSRQVKELTDKLKGDVESAVEAKLKALINEDVAFTDKWGKPEFVGSVEDYIKRQIDEKLFKPVDSSGKTVTGCSANAISWIEWSVSKETEAYIRTISNRMSSKFDRFCNNELDSHLEKFKNETLSELIRERLEAVGIK